MSIFDDAELVKGNIEYIPLWPYINYRLEKAYDNDLLLNDDTFVGYGLKNTIRHFVGSAFSTLRNGEDKTRELARLKERYDYNRDNGISYDTLLDFRHNNDGIDYAKTHPNSNLSDIINAGYEYARKNYLRDYLSGNEEKAKTLQEKYMQEYNNRLGF